MSNPPPNHQSDCWMQRVPVLLIASRVVMGPLLILVCLYENSPAVILTILILAMLSDLFDGIVARRLRVVTAELRIADSRADAWFFACIGVAAWLTVSDEIRRYSFPLITELVLQAAAYSYDLARYRRIVTLHAYSAKIWGMSLYAAASALLAFHYGGLIWLSFAFGLISCLDATAIKIILPGWRHDILSTFHALRLRRDEKAA